MTSCRSVGNIFVKEMAFAMVLVLSFSVAAKTTTWKGGAGVATAAGDAKRRTARRRLFA